MFQQVPVTRAPCFEALSLTLSPLARRGWLTCKQPCQGRTLKSLVGGALWSSTYTVIPGVPRATHSGEKSIWRGLQPEPWCANGIGHRADTSTFTWGRCRGGGGELRRVGSLPQSLMCRCEATSQAQERGWVVEFGGMQKRSGLPDERAEWWRGGQAREEWLDSGE